MLLINFKDPKIYILAAVAIILLVALVIFFRHFIVSRAKAKKIVAELERKYEHLHAVLIGRNAQYIKRLEIISHSNLLYTQIHEDFLSRFRIILESSDKQAQYAIAFMEELVVSKRYSEFKTSLDKNLRIVELFEAQVNELSSDLESKLAEEEKCRNAALAVKEKFRTIKTIYFEKQSELISIERTFSKAFAGIEAQFNEYEKYVESAYYDEANALLPTINAMLDELNYALKELPTLCVLVDVTLPTKISSLQEEVMDMKAKGIPIHHLQVQTLLNKMTEDLYVFQNRLGEFKLKGIKENLLAISSQIDQFHVNFEEEKNAKNTFDSECEATYEKVALLERQFIVLRQRLIKVKEVYRLDESYLDKMDQIQNEINTLGVIKRQLDTYIHASTKQPYSMLLGKMNELKESALETENNILDFNNYIDSLKTDSDEAYSLVNDSYIQLKQAEKLVRDIAVNAYQERVKDRFAQCYQYLDNIYNILIVTPINVKEINAYVKAFKVVFAELILEVKEQARFASLAELAIVDANQERINNPEYDKSLTRAERYFESGDFEKAYQEASAVVKKINSQNE